MKFDWKKTVEEDISLVDFIAKHCDISKSQIKKALNFGGGWLQKHQSSKRKRCRRAQTLLQTGDTVWFYFDERLLSRYLPTPQVIQENQNWSLWYRPADLVSQGSPYGDKGCMLDQVESISKKSTFLIHRLDKEASGLMLFAHNKKAAALLSTLWQSKSGQAADVKKFYQAQVEGHVEEPAGSIELPLDGKKSTTHYRVHQRLDQSSLLSIQIETGRFHQIRRHFAHIGHPLIGDPRHCGRTKNKQLQLVANQIIFRCPFSHSTIDVCLPQNLSLF